MVTRRALRSESETKTADGLPEASAEAGEGAESGPEVALGQGVWLGRYVVLELLSRGGMGEVYAAYDSELGRKVALKVLRGDRARGGQEAQERLVHEAKAVARLSHSNVVTLFDVGSVGGLVFLTMELLDGLDLAAWLQVRPRTVHEVLRVFGQAGRGLAAAHQAGLVHRDFKPGNVMVTQDDRVVVLDFGLAGEAGTLGRAGTPAYMAPEQRAGEQVDHRADQWSFCAALSEALGGEPNAMPGWVRRVIHRGLARDPSARFATMDELLAAVDRDPAVYRRRWAIAAALAATAAAAVGAWQHYEASRSLVCKGAERKLDGVWDATRKAEVRKALALADPVYGPQAWPRVESLLDAYTRSWVRQHTAACESTRLRGEQSEALLDLRMVCLESRREEIAAATALLARADAEVTGNAVDVARGLSGLGGCADGGALLAVAAPEDDPVVRSRIAALRAELARGEALERAAKYPEALAVLEAANRAADATGYAPLRAELRLRLGAVRGRLGRPDAMRETLLEAVELAQASRHDEVVAQATSFLILASSLLGQPAETEVWERLSKSALERLGGNVEIAGERHLFLGMAAVRSRRPEEAIGHFQAFLSLERKPGDEMRQAAHTAHLSLGVAYGELGRLEDARRHLERSLEEGIRAYGPDHPGGASSLANLGLNHRRRGDLSAARDAYSRSLAIFDRLHWTGREILVPLTGLAETLTALGRNTEAEALFERARHLGAAVAAGGP